MRGRRLTWIALAGAALLGATLLFLLRPRLERTTSVEESSPPVAPSVAPGPSPDRGAQASAHAEINAPAAATPPTPSAATGAPGEVPQVDRDDTRAPETPLTYEQRVESGLDRAHLDPGASRRIRPVVERALREYDAKMATGVFLGGDGSVEHRRWAQRYRIEMMAASPGMDWETMIHAFPELR